MPLRLIIALTLSLVLHGALLFTDVLKLSSPPAAPALRASLRLPPEPPPETQPPQEFDPLIKNTIDEEAQDKKPAEPPPPLPKKRDAPAKNVAERKEIQSFQRKLSKYIHYPEQAIKLGLEGTVGLFVELTEDGRVKDVHVVSSSGFPILDNAAVKGVYAIGSMPNTMPQPFGYEFRLD